MQLILISVSFSVMNSYSKIVTIHRDRYLDVSMRSLGGVYYFNTISDVPLTEIDAIAIVNEFSLDGAIMGFVCKEVMEGFGVTWAL